MLNPKIDLDGMNKYIYDSEWSDLWQTYFSERPTTQATADFLASLIPGGRALEIGIGSGRVAIPLAARGVKVTGIDTSVHMLKYLEKMIPNAQLKQFKATLKVSTYLPKISILYILFPGDCTCY